MIDLDWSSNFARDPLVLADAIELTVAFSEESNGRYTQADFLHDVAESFNQNGSDFPSGDQIDESVRRFEQAVTVIRDRSTWLDDSYPFKVVKREVQFDPCANTKLALPYLFMLVCANDNFVPDLQEDLALQFEYLCKEALEVLFPEWAEVLMFSNKSDDRKVIFGYQANKAVPILADKLNTRVNDDEELSEGGREYGIDIVVICGFGDASTYPYFAFAQCTIGQRWWDKRHEAKAETQLTGVVKLNANHTNFLMIPHLPRYNLDGWSQKSNLTGDCIICDRFRICRMLEKSKSFDYERPPSHVSRVFATLEGSLVQSVD